MTITLNPKRCTKQLPIVSVPGSVGNFDRYQQIVARMGSALAVDSSLQSITATNVSNLGFWVTGRYVRMNWSVAATGNIFLTSPAPFPAIVPGSHPEVNADGNPPADAFFDPLTNTYYSYLGNETHSIFPTGPPDINGYSPFNFTFSGVLDSRGDPDIYPFHTAYNDLMAWALVVVGVSGDLLSSDTTFTVDCHVTDWLHSPSGPCRASGIPCVFVV